MKIKYLFLFSALFVLCACSNSEIKDNSIQRSEKVDYGLMDLANEYHTLEELSQASSLIAEVVLTGDSESMEYEGANFTLTDARVKDVIKGNESYNNQVIKIFEVQGFDMNSTKTNGKYILFMKRYEGPLVSEEAFVITGAYQGKFSIDNNKVIYDAAKYNGKVFFQDEINNSELNQFKDIIK